MKEQFINWLKNDSENLQFILFFTLLLIFTVAEFIVPKRKRSDTKRRWIANYAITFVNIIFLSALPVSFISVSFFAEERHVGILNQFHIPFVWLFIITLLLRGFISFFTHFLSHKIPLFWRLHRVHHLDTELDVSTTVRFHPFEFLINLLIGIPIILIFGLQVWGMMFYELLDVVVTLFSHSNFGLPKKIERWLRYIIVTPDIHRIHHSSWQKETDSNYGAVFPIWDIIFKTFVKGAKQPQEKMELGLTEVRDKRTSNIFWLLISPIKKFKN